MALLASNPRKSVDPAFAKALEFNVHFPDPKESCRSWLWNQASFGVSVTSTMKPRQRDSYHDDQNLDEKVHAQAGGSLQ